MNTVYRVTVEAAKKKDLFTVTWQNTGTNTSETVETSASHIAPGEVERFREKPHLYMEIGRKLFGFLDTKKHLLQNALDEASRGGGPLTLLLCPHDPTADWPFELLARDNSFLLPHGLHLVRCVSPWGAEKKPAPQNRPLKLLFMACSALDVHSELDFEREEETIFRVTEKGKGAGRELYTLDDLGDHRNAVDYYQQALNIDRAVFGEQHPNVAGDLNNLGSVYCSLGQRDTAKGYFEKAHAIFKKFFGDDHPHTKAVAEWLEDC